LNARLPIQSGKTFAGGRMICELVRQGKKVGITAMSHKVIRNPLGDVVEAAPELALRGLRCIQRVSEKPEEDPPGIEMTTDNATPLAALRDVVSGTAWMWARGEGFASGSDVASAPDDMRIHV
jgi:uncharacterized protein